MKPPPVISASMFRPKKSAPHIIPLKLSLLDRAGRTRQQHQQQQRPRTEDDGSTMMISLQDTASLQTKLFGEASFLTRALYRKCLRSIKLLARANDRDEEDFSARESNRFDEDRMMMTPPVDRHNELQSRVEYYKAFTRENFDGHFNLLGMHGFYIGNDGNMTQGLGGAGRKGGYRYQGGNRHYLVGPISAKNENPVLNTHSMENSSIESSDDTAEHYVWREEQIEQFVYLIRSGEEKRQWILNDYGFDDISKSSEELNNDETERGGWSQELENRLQTFEIQSKSLVKAMYKHKGWLHSTDYDKHSSDDDDGFFDESDTDQSAGKP